MCIDAEKVIELDDIEKEIDLAKKMKSSMTKSTKDYAQEYESKMMECLDILLENKFNPEAQNLYLG